MMAPNPEDTGDVKRTALSWLFRQEAQTVLLFLIVISIGYLGYYAIDKAIPAHLETIQKGYDRTQANYDKSIDRISKDYTAHHDELVELVREMNGKPPREKTAAGKASD